MSEFAKVLLFDFLAPVIVAYVVYQNSSDPKEALTCIVLAVALCAVSLCAQLQLQLRSTKEYVAKLIGFPKVMPSAEQADQILALGRAYAEIVSKSPNSFSIKIASQIVQNTENYLSQLRASKVELINSSSDPLWTFPIASLAQATTTIFATSIAQFGKFWDEEFGQAYFAQNKEAVTSGKRITRIFLIQDHQELESVRGKIQRHFETGIEIKLAALPQLPTDLHEDFAIFDNRFVTALKIFSRVPQGVIFDETDKGVTAYMSKWKRINEKARLVSSVNELDSAFAAASMQGVAASQS